MSFALQEYRDAYDVPWVRTSVRILGRDQINTFEAMCLLEGRRPHELAHQIVLDAIREAQRDSDVQQVVSNLRRFRVHLRVVDEEPA